MLHDVMTDERGRREDSAIATMNANFGVPNAEGHPVVVDFGRKRSTEWTAMPTARPMHRSTCA